MCGPYKATMRTESKVEHEDLLSISSRSSASLSVVEGRNERFRELLLVGAGGLGAAFNTDGW